MELTIKINLNNAAFQDDPGELGRILRELADKTDRFTLTPEMTPTIRDINGNSVGQVIVSDD